MPGPHSVLSVQIGASDQEIKKAYHKKAILLHPDKNGGSVEAKENFIELQKAFEKLTRRDEDEGEAVPFATAGNLHTVQLHKDINHHHRCRGEIHTHPLQTRL